MDDSNNSEGYLLELANSILALLNLSAKIENEEDLFSDEFYLTIISVLIQEGELDLKPGKTPEEKVKTLKGLLDYLSSMLETELPKIDVKAIIHKHDREPTKDLLELLFSLIQTIIKANLEQMGEDIELDDNEEIKSHSFNENKLNLSEKKKSEKMRLDKDEEIDLENLESLRLGKDKDKKKEKSVENKDAKDKDNKDNKDNKDTEEEKKIEDNSLKDNNINNILNNDDDEDLKDLKDIKNSSTNKKKQKDSADKEKDKIIEKEGVDIKKLAKQFKDNDEDFEEEENLNNLKEKETDDMNIFNDSNDIKINNNITDTDKKSSVKKSNEIPNLLDVEENSDFKKAKNQFEDIRISGQDNSDLGINYSEQHQAYSVPQTQNKLQLPSASEENELENDDDFDYNYKEDKKSKKEDTLGTNSNINNISQNSKSNKKKENKNDSNNLKQSSDKKKSNKKNSSSKKELESSNKKSSNKKEKSENEKKMKDNENSEKLNVEGEGEGEGIQGGDQGEKKVGEGNQISPEQKNTQTNEEENAEYPIIDEGAKYEIMKEFRRIYGDKLDNIFLKHNLEISRNTLELALRNIKLAKQKMMKIGNRIPEVDDLKTKEYLLKYEKERQMMEINYNRDQKKLNFFEQRAINNFKQNIKDMKKAKEIEAKKTENEIERRRKAQEVRNHHNQVKFCNEIYQRALVLEKEKNLEKIKKKREKNRKENEEKRLAMERIENYYKDQIRLLREILEKEKKQKEIEHRAHIQFLSKLEKEKRNEYKKELDNIFDRFDQEEKRNEFERKNKKELAKIFESYYGSK